MRVVLVWLGCALALAAVACDGEPTSPPAPAEPAPLATATDAPTAEATQGPTSATTPVATTTPEPTPTAAPTSTPGPTPTAAPALTPTPTPSPTPEPTPEPRPIEVTHVTRGDPRPLPASIALYYWVAPCIDCGGSPIDYRRVVFDEAVGTLREDRPLAFFDGANDETHYYAVRSFGVSKSGQTLAATVCHSAYCEIEPVGGEWGPSIDSELRLWVTRDGGSTWDDWGQLLPQTRILQVTDDDVLVGTENIWDTRWEWLTDEEWDEMLARLLPLGLDDRHGWNYRYHWVASGKRVDRPVRNARAEDRLPLAIEERDGSVGNYIWTDELEGPFAENDLLIRPTSVYHSNSHLAHIATMEIVDLTTSSVHEVEGLALPLGFDPEAGKQQEDYYLFITARPAPASLWARPVVHYVPLTLAEPRPQPSDVAIYYGAHSCEGVWDVYKTVPGDDGETVAVERPWAYFDERPGYITSFGLGPRAQTLAALECSRGFCGSGQGGPSENALLALWVSRDAGATWEEWGEVPPYTWIETVTEDDVALWQWLDREASQTWWFRSGKEVAPPEGHEVDWFAGWFPDEEGGASPLWKLRGYGASYVTATGRTLLVPASGDDEAWSPLFLADGVLWSQVERERADLFVVQDGTGAVQGTYTWTDSDRRLRLNAPLEDQRFLGELGPWMCGPDTTKVLVDFATRTVHPLPELAGRGLLRLLAAHSLTE